MIFNYSRHRNESKLRNKLLGDKYIKKKPTNITCSFLYFSVSFYTGCVFVQLEPDNIKDGFCRANRILLKQMNAVEISLFLHELPARIRPLFGRSWARLDLHSVRALRISAPDSSCRRCWHSMSAASGEPSALLSETAVSDRSTLSFPHSLLYSRVKPASS